jgi:hypothetical protein
LRAIHRLGYQRMESICVAVLAQQEAKSDATRMRCRFRRPPAHVPKIAPAQTVRSGNNLH